MNVRQQAEKKDARGPAKGDFLRLEERTGVGRTCCFSRPNRHHSHLRKNQSKFRVKRCLLIMKTDERVNTYNREKFALQPSLALLELKLN